MTVNAKMPISTTMAAISAMKSLSAIGGGGVPRASWPRHLDDWLLELGRDQHAELAFGAGCAAGHLYCNGHRAIETRLLPDWIKDSSTQPLHAVDGCYTVAASSSAALQSEIAKKLMHWGHLGEGIDGIFALGHLVSNSYGLVVDRPACLAALEKLALQPNLAAFLHADTTYCRLFARLAEEPTACMVAPQSLCRAFEAAGEIPKLAERRVRTLQVLICGLSLLDTEAKIGDRPRAPVIDRVLDVADDLTPLAQLVNACLLPTSVQPRTVIGLRKIFVRKMKDGPANSAGDCGILRLLGTMHGIGDADARERIECYLEDWHDYAAEQELPGTPAVVDLLDKLKIAGV
jgi:hypothetical protein